MMMTVSQVKEDMLNTSVRQMAVIARFGSEQDCSQPSDPFPAIAMPGHSGLDGLIRPVITSYSIHYTKLYEKRQYNKTAGKCELLCWRT